MSGLHLETHTVVAHLGLRGRLTLHRGRAWTFMSADLAGQDARRLRICGRILGDAMPPRPSARQSHLSALAGHAVHSFHAKRSAAWPDLADLLSALRRE
eukprot:scaffold7312_cov64-Phaeocystis_antarctica.AAC.4